MTHISTDRPSDSGPTFKDGETSFGSFYPKHYLLAVLPDDATAARAGDALRAAGFAADDVVSMSGPAVVAYAATEAAGQGVLEQLREQWSRFYTDASAASQRLVDHAKHGAAFVLAYAPDDADTTRAADVLRPLQPVMLRSYGAFTVTDLQ